MNASATPLSLLRHTCVRVIDSNPELRIARVEDMHQFEAFIDDTTALAGPFPLRGDLLDAQINSHGHVKHAAPL